MDPIDKMMTDSNQDADFNNIESTLSDMAEEDDDATSTKQTWMS
jgi:hypothetical protein